MMGTRVLFAAVAALCATSCTIEQPSELDESTTIPLDDGFAAASRMYGVPVDLLKAIAYVETGWQSINTDAEDGHEDEHGQGDAYGVFALRGDNLTRGAAAAGLSEAEVQRDPIANITAAAARMHELAVTAGVTGDMLSMWEPVVAQFAQIPDDEARDAYVRGVMRVLATGVRATAEDGAVIASLDPHAEIGMPGTTTVAATTSDFSDALWRPSPNFNARSTAVSLVVIHACEGNYAGCWGWLKNASSGVSAHYVVNESGSEVTQLVKESNRAWHVSANYECSRAGNQQCSKNGTSTNNFAVGIEHAGFGSQKSWSSGLIETSARLVCDITKRHNIPRDKNHIVAHGALQPWNRTDPGAAWPWDHYIERVRYYCGDTTSTPPSSGSTPIIIDSNNSNNNASVAKIALEGSWTSSSSQAGYYGTGYWVASTQETASPATFYFYLPTAQTRTIDAWWTTASNRATAAPFIAFDAAGNELGRTAVNQRQNGSQWVKLGTYNFTAGWNKVVLSRWTTLGQYVVADAVRVR